MTRDVESFCIKALALRVISFLAFQGDCTKAKKELGWVPEISFSELVKDMMKADIEHVDAGNDHL